MIFLCKKWLYVNTHNLPYFRAGVSTFERSVGNRAHAGTDVYRLVALPSQIPESRRCVELYLDRIEHIYGSLFYLFLKKNSQSTFR